MGDGICYQHPLTRVVFIGEIIVLQAEQHSLKVGWSIYKVLHLDLLEGLVIALNRVCTAKNMWSQSTTKMQANISHSKLVYYCSAGIRAFEEKANG